jgi:hypothetical protein
LYSTNNLVVSEPGGPVVASTEALEALDMTARPDGAEVKTLAHDQPWVYSKSSVAAADGVMVLTATPVGRWLRRPEPSQKWTNQVNWYVSTSVGDDRNIGTVAAPLATVAEFTRRVKRAKYGSGFGPYVLNCVSDIPNTDSFQWSPEIESISGTISTDPDTGLTAPILRIVGTKTTAGSGAVNVFTAPAGSAKCTFSRAAGAFAIGDIVEFTSGAAAGKRAYILGTSGGALVGHINAATFYPLAPAYPVNGDTFNVVTLSKWGPQIQGVGMPQAQIDIENLHIPTVANGGCGRYEAVTVVLRFCNCLLNVLIQPGLASRVKFGKFNNQPCGVILPLADYPVGDHFTPERGDCISIGTSWYNVYISVIAAKGIGIFMWDENQLGCWRSGMAGENFGDSGVLMGLVGCRIFDFPTTVPAVPYIGTGGSGDSGAAVIAKRAKVLIANSFGQPCVSNSPNAGTVGLYASESADVRVVGGAPPDLTGFAQDIIMDGTMVIPFVDPLTGIPIAGQVLTTWADWANAAKFNGNALNCVNGTRIVTGA